MAGDPPRSGGPDVDETDELDDDTRDTAAAHEDDAVHENNAVHDNDGADYNDGADDRTVVVPTDVYKRVTVFSTLFAVFAVVGGFLLLDVATDRATAELTEIDPLVALAGVALIVGGAVTYAFSTRFQAEGMGNAKDDTDEPSNNG